MVKGERGLAPYVLGRALACPGGQMLYVELWGLLFLMLL